MRSLLLLCFSLSMSATVLAQDLEIRSTTDLRQPGLTNPALAGIREDMFRILSNTDLNNFSFMVEGRIPFKLGNYLIGVQRTGNDEVTDNMFNLTYGRTEKKDNGLSFRYGGSLEIHSRSSLSYGDSAGTGLFAFTDLDGQRTEFQSIDQLTGEINYMNLDFGASINYDKLLVSFALNNALAPDVSLIKGEKRKLATQAHLTVGGFIPLSDNYIFYPSAMAIYTGDNYLARAGIEVHSKYVNLAARYTMDEEISDFTASIATSLKRTYVGLSYTQSFNDGGIPEFKVFLNSSIFKPKELFKSDFAKHMLNFY